MKFRIFISLLLINSLQLFNAQEVMTTHVAVFFESNQHKLSPQNKIKIDSMMFVIPFDKIYLEGYADSIGNVKYNMQLSKKRALEIVNYIKTKHGYFNIDWAYKGQDHDGANQLSNQRRVDIIFSKSMTPADETIYIENQTETKPAAVSKVMAPIKIIEAPTNDPDKEEKINEILTKDTILFSNVLFEPGSNEFLHNKIPNELYYLAYALEDSPNMKIEISGHVCCIDSKKLSDKRAKAVYDFLISQGIDKKRLTYKGYSNYKPLVKELTPEDERQNRRVEVIVLSR